MEGSGPAPLPAPEVARHPSQGEVNELRHRPGLAQRREEVRPKEGDDGGQGRNSEAQDEGVEPIRCEALVEERVRGEEGGGGGGTAAEGDGGGEGATAGVVGRGVLRPCNEWSNQGLG